MALWTSQEIVAATGGTLAGPAFAAEGVAIDSREVAPGDLFVALQGERDGHAFVAQALARGAAGALVSQPAEGPAIRVDDTLEALRRLGAAARERAPEARRGAVTGSVGKTSLTQAVLAGLTLAGAAHGPERSFNNHIGVPLTLARMPAGTRRAVFEMGMNHAGEIAPLSRLARPRAAAVTLVGAVHVENFADGEAGVARAKAEIFEGLEPGGVAILPADGPWLELLSEVATARGAQVRTFGSAAGAQARLLDFRATGEGAVVAAEIDGEPLTFPLRLTQRHWGPMSLAALLLMEALDVERETALAALAGFVTLAGRGAERPLSMAEGEALLIDDSYNANPISMRAALESLGARRGRRIAVLTDMLELGPDAEAAHAGLAQPIEAAGVDLVFCAGPLMRGLYEALPPARRGAFAPCAGNLVAPLREALRPGDVVMVKGSKGSKAWAVAAALTAEAEGA